MLNELFKVVDDVQLEDFMLSIGNERRRINIPHMSFSPFAEKGESKVDVSKIPDMMELCKKCIAGVKSLDSAIDSLKMLRGSLVRDVLSIRNAFPSFNPAATERLRQLSESKDGAEECAVRCAFAQFLGYESLPECIVNVRVRSENSSVAVLFGINNRPTKAFAVIPTTVDYCNSSKMRRWDDENRFESYPAASLEYHVPYLKLGISVGAGVNDGKVVKLESVDNLRKAIEALFGYDIRSSISKITDVSQAKTAEQFKEWRMLRYANAQAADNATKAKA